MRSEFSPEKIETKREYPIPEQDPLELEYWEQWKERYEEFKKETPELARTKMSGFNQECPHAGSAIIRMILMQWPKLEFIQNKLSGKPLYDIGAGFNYIESALTWYGYGQDYVAEVYGKSAKEVDEKWPKNIGISEVVAVDPFYGEPSSIVNMEYAVTEILERRNAQVTKDQKKEFSKKIYSVKKDGLTFLESLPVGAGNIMMGSVDLAIVGDSNWFKRISQEAFRVIPQKGIYITAASGDYGSDIFPYNLNINRGVDIYSKSPLPKDYLSLKRES